MKFTHTVTEEIAGSDLASIPAEEAYSYILSVVSNYRHDAISRSGNFVHVTAALTPFIDVVTEGYKRLAYGHKEALDDVQVSRLNQAAQGLRTALEAADIYDFDEGNHFVKNAAGFIVEGAAAMLGQNGEYGGAFTGFGPTRGDTQKRDPVLTSNL